MEQLSQDAKNKLGLFFVDYYGHQEIRPYIAEAEGNAKKETKISMVSAIVSWNLTTAAFRIITADTAGIPLSAR